MYLFIKFERLVLEYDSMLEFGEYSRMLGTRSKLLVTVFRLLGTIFRMPRSSRMSDFLKFRAESLNIGTNLECWALVLECQGPF